MTTPLSRQMPYWGRGVCQILQAKRVCQMIFLLNMYCPIRLSYIFITNFNKSYIANIIHSIICIFLLHLPIYIGTSSIEVEKEEYWRTLIPVSVGLLVVWIVCPFISLYRPCTSTPEGEKGRVLQDFRWVVLLEVWIVWLFISLYRIGTSSIEEEKERVFGDLRSVGLLEVWIFSLFISFYRMATSSIKEEARDERKRLYFLSSYIDKSEISSQWEEVWKLLRTGLNRNMLLRNGVMSSKSAFFSSSIHEFSILYIRRWKCRIQIILWLMLIWK